MMLKQLATTLVFTLAGVVGATAASGDAWAEFATAVEKGCLDATASFFSDARAVVDPFGSESYGLAIVTGETPAGTTASIVCVFNKQTEAIEIGGELEVVVTPLETAE